jgi:hypothetical protein
MESAATDSHRLVILKQQALGRKEAERAKQQRLRLGCARSSGHFTLLYEDLRSVDGIVIPLACLLKMLWFLPETHFTGADASGIATRIFVDLFAFDIHLPQDAFGNPNANGSKEIG